MGKIVAVANQKGGVGKTTTTVNLGAYLAVQGSRVLIVDIDPQGNAGSGLGFSIMDLKKTIYQLLLGEVSIGDSILNTNIENLSIIASNIDLSGIEIDLKENERKDYILKEKIKSVQNDYDYILIDSPPSLGLLTINALTAAKSVLIPLQCEYFALEGLAQLLRVIKLTQKELNPNLMLEGVLLTMYDSRTKLASQVVQDVREHFGGQVFEIIIPRNVKLSEAPSFGEPISVYEPNSAGAIAYQQLAKELVQKFDAE